MYRKAPGKMGVSVILGGNRYLVPFNGGIATISVRTGRAMTGTLEQIVKHFFLASEYSGNAARKTSF